MKQTHKLRALGDVSAVVAAAPSLSAAARTLGVNRSTLHRWIQARKVAAPSRHRPLASAGAAVGPDQSPEAWAEAIRRDFELSATEAALLDLAVRALTMARDESVRHETRLAAMGRYSTLVRQLALEEAANGEAKATADVRSWPRPA